MPGQTKKQNRKGVDLEDSPKKNRAEFSDGGQSEDEDRSAYHSQQVRKRTYQPNPQLNKSGTATYNRQEEDEPTLHRSKRNGQDCPLKLDKSKSLEQQRDVIEEILQITRENAKKEKGFEFGNLFNLTFIFHLSIILVCFIIQSYYLNGTAYSDHVSHSESLAKDINKEANAAISMVKEYGHVFVKEELSAMLREYARALVKQEFDTRKESLDEIILSKSKDYVANEFKMKVLDHFEKHINPKIEGVTSDLERLDRAIGSVDVKTMQKDVETLKESVKDVSKIKENQGKMGNIVSVLSGRSLTITRKVRDLRNKYFQVVSRLNLADQKREELENKIWSEEKQRVKDSEHLERKLQKLTGKPTDMDNLFQKYNADISQIESLNSTLTEIYRNTFNKEKFILAILVIVAVEGILGLAVYVLYQRSEQHNHVQENGDPFRRFLQSRVPEKAVCIISFDEARSGEHKRLLDSANIPNCKVYTHVIRTHQQIDEMPRCRVYLMCTDFSERHIIIEEQGKGLGDLHKKTYEAVRDRGGCMVILYTKDPGSRNLNDDALYNTNIYCVTHQPELQVLETDDRFISTYDNLTSNQKIKLRQKIVENL